MIKLPQEGIDGPFSEWPNFSVTIGKPGLLDSLQVEVAPRRPPGPSEIEIEVRAVGLNFKEVLLALGMLPTPEDGLTFGLECAGVITEVGPDVVGLEPGMQVIAIGGPCLAALLTVHTSCVVPKPAHLSWEQAAGLGISYLTAYYALHRLGRLQRHESVLIHAAAGGVGIAAVRVAQWLGAEIFATAGSPRKREYLHDLGIKHVFDSRSLAFADEIMERTGHQGVSVVLNSLAGDFIPKSLSVLAPFGRFLEIGRRDVFANTPLPLGLLEKGAGFFVVNLSPSTPGFHQMFAEVMNLVEEGTFRPLPCQVFSLRRLDEALDHMARAQHIGKVAISIPKRKASSSQSIPPISMTGTGPLELEGPRRPILSEGLLNAEGIDIFRRVLAGNLAQVIVSTRSLDARAADELELPQLDEESERPSRSSHVRPDLTNAYVPPRNDLEGIICGIWEKFLRIKLIGIHDNFFDLGGDSLLAVQLIARLREAVDVELSPHSILDTPTIAGLAESIARSRMSMPEIKQKAAVVELPKCLVQIKDGDPSQPLYLIHSAGGHVYNYLALAHTLSTPQMVFGVQAETNDSLGRPLETLEHMATHYIEQIRKFQPQGPYLIGGASFGGALAFEMAQQLVDYGQTVPLVFLIDTGEPDRLPKQDLENAEVLSYWLRMAVDITDSQEDLKQLLPDEQISYFLDRSKKANKQFPALSLGDAKQLLQQLRTNIRAMSRYKPRPYPGRLAFFQASEESREYEHNTNDTAWPKLAMAGGVVQRTPGNHVTMIFMPHVQVLGDRLSQILIDVAAGRFGKYLTPET